MFLLVFCLQSSTTYTQGWESGLYYLCLGRKRKLTPFKFCDTKGESVLLCCCNEYVVFPYWSLPVLLARTRSDIAFLLPVPPFWALVTTDKRRYHFTAIQRDLRTVGLWSMQEKLPSCFIHTGLRAHWFFSTSSIITNPSTELHLEYSVAQPTSRINP